MRLSGSPQSIFGLFGGPGFLLACLLLLFIAGAVAYLALTEEGPTTGAATVSLPASTIPEVAAAGAGSQMASVPAVPVAKDVSVGVAIEEDLSPTELLAKYPPEASDALAEGDGSLPAWRRFGRPSAVSSEAPRVALLIAGLGRDRTDTVRAITGTPPEASLSFAADTPELPAWIAAARAYGHEAFMDVALDQPAGAGGLARDQTPEENLRRLDALLARAPEIAGITVSGGDAFLADAAALQPILKHAQTRGLAVIGLPVTAPLTRAADEVLLREATETAIGQSIETLMASALRRGDSLGVVPADSAATLFPAWRRALVGRDEISLVPATALVEE